MRHSNLLPFSLLLPLAGCSLISQPEPNATLVELAAQAQYESQTYQTPSLKELRTGDAEELIAEILRECGHRDDGQQPESCDRATVDDAISAAALDQRPGLELFDVSASNIANVATTAPQDAMPVIVQQVLDLVAAGSATPNTGAAELRMNKELKSQGISSEAVNADAEDARSALKEEFATRYALGVAQAYAEPGTAGAIAELRAAHQSRIDLLESSLAPTEDVPVAEPAYEIAGTVPENPGSAAVLVDELHQHMVDTYAHLAAQARTPSWRMFCLAMASQSLRG
ncbi:DUF4439 domain-containing protein [Corynebacterium gerontici]|uniref:DUF4439 domain-containing protein n=1 Tax=Corynebacterium gerontici TaxID=2079234 RepID=A0A3G6J102_9CORY|nr:DUF4439 domain-containing protein [Corynebacterium gerontici]AZA11639.1 hypothetical protein CGERO_06695 [Corynebacterium gerontici]